MNKQIRVKKCIKYPDGIKKIDCCFNCVFYLGSICNPPHTFLHCKMFGYLPINGELKLDKIHPGCELEDYGTEQARKVEDELPKDEKDKLIEIKNRIDVYYDIGFYSLTTGYWHDSRTEETFKYPIEIISWQPLPGEEG